jgi:hypothetical protein
MRKDNPSQFTGKVIRLAGPSSSEIYCFDILGEKGRGYKLYRHWRAELCTLLDVVKAIKLHCLV